MKVQGRIIKIGQLEQTNNGATLCRIVIRIGYVNRFDRNTGQPVKVDDAVSYTFWHDEARMVPNSWHVNDVVEFEMSHYVDSRWGRTEVNCNQIKLVQAGGAPYTAQQQAVAPGAPAQNAPNMAAPQQQMPYTAGAPNLAAQQAPAQVAAPQAAQEAATVDGLPF